MEIINMKTLVRRYLLVFSAIVIGAITVLSQSSTGDLRGTVTDVSGAVISGATVEIRNQRTNE